MMNPRMLVSFLNAPVFCVFWLTKHTVDSVQLSAPEVVEAAPGGSVTVSCQYDLQFRDYTKYWCKGPVYERCKIVVKTPKNRNNKNCLIADDKDKGVFTVTMTSLSQSDQDTYWCVIARHGRNNHCPVSLRISHSYTVTTIMTTANSSSVLEQNQISWWATLRWILFILLLSCLVATHIAMWRIKAARTIHLHRKSERENPNIYAETSSIATI
ncbi:CMRF35-like molecule 3 [Sphaeramia orbicularis]|uniref:CMRF35-like molecule 3 n=1 Tax=Sphaeramia orbicularis TaxID=375764 RepID=UPI00117C3B3D|nr:CMRF35-like molecule 3 [Sphaeramia orbicularis]